MRDAVRGRVAGALSLPVEIAPHPRAKTLKLRVHPLRRSVVVTTPPQCSERQVERFVAQQREWIDRQLARLPDLTPLADGVQYPVLGEWLTIRFDAALRGRVRDRDGMIYVPGPAMGKARKLRRFLEQRLLGYVADQAHEYATRLERRVTQIRLREMRSRWGSCSSEGGLCFNWRLVFAPPEVTDYVVAHEAAHLVEMNHSADFWRLVAALYPEYRSAKRWLRRESQQLFCYLPESVCR